MGTSQWWQCPGAQEVLTDVLQEINRGRASREDTVLEGDVDAARKMLAQIGVSPADLAEYGAREFVERLLDRPETRLAVYGSLAPGERNHWVVEKLAGIWEAGFVHGTLESVGWGDALGYPGMTWVPQGEAVPVKLFTCNELPGQWARLDEFEGRDYCRILVPVHGLADGVTVANIYEVRSPPGSAAQV